MTASVITGFAKNVEDATLGRTPYVVEIKGQNPGGVRVAELMDADTGTVSIEVIAPAPDGKPVLALSTMDALARRVRATAKVAFNGQGPTTLRRVYAV